MNIKRIDKNEWDAGVEKSRRIYALAGPIKEKEFYTFRKLTDGEYPDMSGRPTRLSPKSVLFPQSEPLLCFSSSGKNASSCFKEVKNNQKPCAVIGIRPYDAKAISLVRLNFDTPKYKDPYWLGALDRCTFIGLAVNRPESVDFSTSCGTGPFDETGLDVLLVDCDDHYLAKILSDKGEQWSSACGFIDDAEKDADSIIERMKTEAESKITATIRYDRIMEKNLLTLYHSDFWEDAVFGCINCGACTFCCPTCWCFDIQDEVTGDEGVRMRNWDTCMSRLFTHHASGHNPREKGWMRTRQRFMHKLKYFPDTYNQGIMCVGCGRCIRQCPANIDIRAIAELMNA